MEYGWIGGGPPSDVPSLVVSAAHSALGAVLRFQVHVGAHTVLLHPDAGGGWDRRPVDGLDIGAYLAGQLDLGDRDEPAAERWSGTVPLSGYAALRRADPARGPELARSSGCPVELVRALSAPVSLSRVEVLRRDAAARADGPERVVTDELAWVDGGDDGLWTVRPEDAETVRIARGTPAEVAAELTGMVRAAEGC